jgi:hypothetical protein
MWIAGLAAIEAIAATIQLTRPPELVWWTSPAIGNTGNRIRVLVPRGWDDKVISAPSNGWRLDYWIGPVDHRPVPIRWLLPDSHNREWAYLRIRSGETEANNERGARTQRIRREGLDADASVTATGVNLQAFLLYHRSDSYGFDHTVAPICNSLRIE